MIILTKNLYNEILEHSINSLPNEACGLLGGKVINGNTMIYKVYKMTNIDSSPEHYSMDPKEQFIAIKDMRTNDLEMIGNFHSHPSTPSRPSDEDKKLAYDPEAIYLILSLMDIQEPVLKGFRIIKNEVSEEPIEIRMEDFANDKS